MAVGSTPRDSGNIPLGCVLVPGDNTPQALQGGAEFTDAGGNVSAPARVESAGGSKATYTYSINALALLASHTDLLVLRGSATKLVKMTRFEMSGLATTSAQIVALLKKHTIADTGGTGTLGGTATKHDSNDGAATAVINTYQTTLPTVDASATIIKVIRINFAPLATTTIADRYMWSLSADPAEPFVLRGVAQEIALNFNTVTITGGLVDFSITWTEE